MSNRIIDAWWDVTNQRFYNGAGNQISANLFPGIIYQEKVLLRLRLCDGSYSDPYVGMPTGAGVEYLFAGAFGLATADRTEILLSEGANVNADGTWAAASSSGSTNPDPALGQMTVYLDSFNESFQEVVGGKSRREGFLELQAWESDPARQMVFCQRMPFIYGDAIHWDSNPLPTGNSFVEGMANITEGAEYHNIEVTGALRLYTVHVEAPVVGGVMILAQARQPDSSGLIVVDFSAPVPAGYKLHYVVMKTPIA